jgi:flagellar basal body-associated protein FliL
MEGQIDYRTQKIDSSEEPTIAARESEYIPNTPSTDEPATTSNQAGPYPDYVPPTYPAQSPRYISQHGNDYQSPPSPYPDSIAPQQRRIPTTPRPRQNGSRQIIVLLSILVIVLLVAFSLLLFRGSNQPFSFQFSDNAATSTTQPTTDATPQPTNAPSTPTPTATTATATPEQQARTVIEKYYLAINNKDYQTAYNLWAKTTQTYDNFVQGFAHTQRDDIVFGQIAVQSDGSVQVPLTITATSDTGTQSQFNGYYIVGQQPDGSWKIITANIRAIAGG